MKTWKWLVIILVIALVLLPEHRDSGTGEQAKSDCLYRLQADFGLKEKQSTSMSRGYRLVQEGNIKYWHVFGETEDGKRFLCDSVKIDHEWFSELKFE